MQIIHYVCLLPIKGEHKIKYGSTVSAEAEERLLLFSRVLSSNLNLGSGGGPSPSTFAFTQFFINDYSFLYSCMLFTCHHHPHPYHHITTSTFAVTQILNPVIKFGILTTPHHVCIPVIIIPILPSYHYFHHPHYHYHYHHHFPKKSSLSSKSSSLLYFSFLEDL